MTALELASEQALPLRIRLGPVLVDLQGGIVEHPEKGTVNLSPLEARLVRYLVGSGDRLVPKDELLTEVWGYRQGIITRAVDNMLRRLRQKLEPVPGEVRHLENRYGQGIRLVDFESDGAAGLSQPLERELPEYQGALHGRSRDLTLLAESLSRSRLVTITGTGGVGKTRLVVCYVRGLDEDAAVFVSCSSARTPGELDRLVADSLGMREHAPDSVAAALRARGPLLLVLDNLEQVIDGAVSRVGRWLEMASELRVLATSRQRLDLGVEQVFALSGLACPPTEAGPREVLASPGGAFLVECLGRRLPRLSVDDETAPVLAELVRALEGQPLPLELVAGAARSSEVTALRALLKGLVRARGPRDGPARQHSLEASFSWSWVLLEPPLQRALAMLGVFDGGFSRVAAGALLDGDPDEALDELGDRGLVALAGVDRFALLLPIRHHAWVRAGEAGLQELALERHCAWFSERCHGPQGRDGSWSWSRELAQDRTNLLLALRTATEHRDLERMALLAPAISRTLGTRPTLPWLSDLCETHARGPGPHVAALKLLEGRLLTNQSRVSEAERALDQALRRTVDTPRLRAQVLSARANLWVDTARMQEADEALSEAEELLTDGPRDQVWLSVASTRAKWLQHRSHPKEARGLLLEVLHVARRLGDEPGEASALNTLGVACWNDGDPQAAQSWLRLAEVQYRRLGHRSGVADTLVNQGMMLYTAGPTAEWRAALEEALAAYLAEGDALADLVRTNLAHGLAAGGELASSRNLYQEALTGFMVRGDGRSASYVRAMLGELQHRDGEAGVARTMLLSAVETLEALPDPWLSGIVRGVLAEVELALGLEEEAQASIAAGDAWFAQAGDTPDRVEYLARKACVLVALQQDSEARASLAEARRLHERYVGGEGSPYEAHLARAERAVGD